MELVFDYDCKSKKSKTTEVMKKLMNNKPWVEKFRPKDINEIILPELIKKKFEVMANKKIIPNMIITGDPGTGKTSSILALLKKIIDDNYFY
jgi:replication-associated recombination protein RarA